MDPLANEPDDLDPDQPPPRTAGGSRFEEHKARFEQLLTDSRKNRQGNDLALPEFATGRKPALVATRSSDLSMSLDTSPDSPSSFRKPLTAREPVSRRAGGFAPVTSTRLPALTMTREDSTVGSRKEGEPSSPNGNASNSLASRSRTKNGWATPRGQLPVSEVMPNKPKLPEILSFSRQGTEVMDRLKLTDSSSATSSPRLGSAARRQ